jgi:thiamine-phosphate pyrophosphorylase
LKQTGGGDASRLLFAGIYALVSPEGADPVAYVEALLAGGIRLFQIRAKRGIRSDTFAAIIGRVRAQRGLVIVNDDVTLAAQADGVHLGQEDAARHDLRALRVALGAKAIGLSCGTPAQARAPGTEFIDYIGAGPIFATPSKSDAGGPIGVSGVRAVVEATHLPVAAIGGITLDRLQWVRESGAAMAAVISGLATAADTTATARAYVDAWNR